MRPLKKQGNIVRIQFGSKSMAFSDTTIEKVFSIAVKVFQQIRVNSILEVNHSPLVKPTTEIGTVMTVREEGPDMNNGKGKSKSKTLYGISSEDALAGFKNAYKQFL